MAVVTPLGTYGAPPDGVAIAALALGALLLALGWRFRTDSRAVVDRLTEAAPRPLSPRERAALGALSVAAVLLSAGYVWFYLRGGPRIIDATTYWLESLTLASGSPSFELVEPSASFRGRFLLPSLDGARAAPIFPPGYPAVLALGQWVGAPMAVGPILGGLLVLSTFSAARWLFPSAPRVWWLAAALSLTSACLRYHSADTMSHALSALLISTALVALISARHYADVPARTAPRLFCAGLALGLLFATRPVSCLALAPVLLFAAPRGARISWLCFGALPGLLLFVWHQAGATGAPFGSTQLAYYALADGPPGCFGYGFGERGCGYEHGDFVRQYLPHGYGLAEAGLATLRRLKAHLVDAGNLPLFTLMVPAALYIGRKHGVVRLLGLSLVFQVLGYAPFYFDGSYPGGGARFFVDVLPLEHVLLAYGLTQLRLAWLAPGLSLLGFAVSASYDHQALREREGGRPLFEPQLVRALPPGSVVFVDTDHGFNLGHDPRALASARAGNPGAAIVARQSGDARDALLLKGLGDPPAYRYQVDLRGGSAPQLLAWHPPQPGGKPGGKPGGGAHETWLRPGLPSPAQRLTGDASFHLEAEFDYPPVQVTGGWVHPEWPPGDCVSEQRGLRLRASPGSTLMVRLELVGPRPGRYQVRAQFAAMGHEVSATEAELRVAEGTLGASLSDGVKREHRLSVPPAGCAEVLLGEAQLLPVANGRLASSWLQLYVNTDYFVVDRVSLVALDE